MHDLVLMKLEIEVLKAAIFAINGTSEDISVELFNSIIIEHNIEGSGFMTYFSKSDNLKINKIPNSGFWGDISGTITNDKIPVIFTIFFDEMFISAIDGCTLGDSWPSNLESYQLELL